MKKKLIVGIILITMILPMFLNFYKVEAFSGELDPETYISLPFNILVEDGVGTGTISLASSASGYSIAYQKVDLTETQYNNIQNKNNEMKNYAETSTTTLQEKQANVQTLQTEMNNLKESETATADEITAAENAYNAAAQDLQTYANTVITEIEELESEYYALIPDYTNSWTEITNTEDNVQLDFSDYSGTAHFVLWAKITDGTNTYYDMSVYSSEIKTEESVTISETSANIKVEETLQLTATSSTNSDITWTSSDSDVATVDSNGLVTGIAEGTAVITATGSGNSATCTVTVGPKETTNGEWTDFSNAKFELKKDGISSSIIEISNVTPKEESTYYLFITSNSSKPNVTSDDYENSLYLTYDEENKIFIVRDMEKYVELNQDLYASILEVQSYDSENVVVYGKKLERYAEAKYSDAFHATFMSYDETQLITTFTHNDENNRNIQVKVGKITDVSILQKIKNEDSSGFSNLLTFAKSNDGIYNEKLNAHEGDFRIAYVSWGTNGSDAISLEGLQDGEYYFLYIQTLDENGKYISNEAVTLAQASVRENGEWYLFFYGDEDFEWADFSVEEKEDTTKAPVVLPNTGIGKYIMIISILAIVVIASYIQVKKLKEIK